MEEEIKELLSDLESLKKMLSDPTQCQLVDKVIAYLDVSYSCVFMLTYKLGKHVIEAH